jgi:NAD(P)-dependent dehydrogenase (short-subunit alcohol dehydrogenase family)
VNVPTPDPDTGHLADVVPSVLAAGAVVNVSTMAALESLTRSWAAAFGANGIRVNTVAPGPTRKARFGARG